MSTPSIKVGQGNWGIKAGNLLGYANTEKKFSPVEFTSSRALDTATRVNASGNIEIVNANIPRIDYFGGQASLLVEPSGTNLVLQSQAFNVTWVPVIGGTGVNPSITTNAVISPDGTQNAETVVFNRGAGNTSTDQSTLSQNVTIPTTGAYIFSVYAKASTTGDVGKQVFLRIGGAGSLTAITLTANWVRYSRAETSVASGSQPVQIGNRGTVTTDNSVSVDLWGAQAEVGSVATSYIPTTTGTVNRNADVISVTGVSSLIGQTEGTIYAEVDYKNFSTSSQAILHLFQDGNNVIGIQMIRSGSNNLLQAYAFVAGSLVVSITYTIPSAGIYKIALGYKLDDYKLYVNGVDRGQDTSAGVPTMNQILLGHYASSIQFNDRIRAVEIYQTRLPNTTTDGSPSLQSITTL